MNKNFSIFLVFSLAVAVLGFLIAPQIFAIRSNAKKYEISNNREFFLSAQAKEFEKFRQDYPNEDLDRINLLLVDSQNPGHFVDYLEKTAKDRGLEMKLSGFDLAQEKGNAVFNIRILAQGSFENILSYLQDIEEGKSIISAEKVGLKREKEGFSAEILAKAYAK